MNVYYWPLFGLVTLLSLFVLPCLLLLNVFFVRQSPARLIRRAIRVYGWVLVRLVPFMAPVELENRAGDLSLPAIFTANHLSAVDPYLFGLLPLENCFVTSWPFNIPVYGRIMRLARYIYTQAGWEDLARQGSELLSAGCSLIFWPEGHRSRDGRLTRFHKGAFQLACLTGRPVVPVCILGTDHILPPGAIFLRPARARLVLLPPITPDPGMDTHQAVYDLRKKVRQAIDEELSRQKSDVLKAKNIKEKFLESSSPGQLHGSC